VLPVSVIVEEKRVERWEVNEKADIALDVKRAGWVPEWAVFGAWAVVVGIVLA
jgi:hypothetical protein